MKTIILSFLALSFFLPNSENYKELIGTKAPGWDTKEWLNSSILRQEDLKGKVVLVRWWTGPYCPFCRNSSPALSHWYKQYEKEGLVVIGMYHHKSRTRLDLRDVKAMADMYAFDFPIGIDRKWETLKKWWLDRVDADFTSVSFLLDKEGFIQHIHPGGEYIEGDDAYNEMEMKIKAFL